MKIDEFVKATKRAKYDRRARTSTQAVAEKLLQTIPYYHYRFILAPETLHRRINVWASVSLTTIREALEALANSQLVNRVECADGTGYRLNRAGQEENARLMAA